MIRIRIRKDGARELKVENEVHNIPHDHELAPNPTFAAAYREAFFVNSLYMSVSLSDIACANAFVDLAAAQDLTVMSERLRSDVRPLLDQVVQILRNGALTTTSGTTLGYLQERLRDLGASTIEASTGPEFEDDVWYAGIEKDEDDEIERNLEAPFDGGDWYDEVYTEK
jgi:hypothetical protein